MKKCTGQAVGYCTVSNEGHRAATLAYLIGGYQQTFVHIELNETSLF